MKNLKRIIIYPKDIQLLTGKSYRQSLKIYNQVKTQLGKSKDDLLGLKEFCATCKININEFEE